MGKERECGGTGLAGEHAVVLGAGMAGLLAARVLADFYRRVTVFDRDAVPGDDGCRRGVPQARHVHGLHPRGGQVLEELFPGLVERLVADGAVVGDTLRDSRWQLAGHQLSQADCRLSAVMSTRPFLEARVNARVRRLPNVTVVGRTDVVGVSTTPDRSGVTGVRVHGGVNGVRLVPADLVIDATGRGARTPRWLTELGYETPPVVRVDIGLGYASRVYRLRPGALGTDIGVVTAATPDHPRGGALASIEGGRHILTVHGILGDHPPTDPVGIEAFAASLRFTDIADALRGAEPLTDPAGFRFPASVRRRYERLRRFPAGLLVIGDAVCSFNPVYAQGMTVAALQAETLRRLLSRGGPPAPGRYFRAISRTIDLPWDMGAGADLAFPGVRGVRTIKTRVVNSYVPRLCAAAATDPSLGRAFARVLAMVDRPETLLRPDRVLRVLRATRTG